MRSRLLALVGTVALTFGGLLATSGPASADPAHCYGVAHPKVYNSGGIHFGNGTYIYRGPYTDCTPLGQGYPSQGINVHCWYVNSNGVQWIYLIDTSTTVAGWARFDSVSWDGSGIASCYPE